MKTSFFEQLQIPEPDIDLGVGSGTHAQQTAEIMKRFEPVLDKYRPRAVLVVGDVNSTIACALVAVKKGIAVIHVEAGLRSGDRSMPEEINRVLTDQISDLLFTTEKDAEGNLKREGIDAGKVYFVGNVMIDSLMFNLKSAVDVNRTVSHLLPDSGVNIQNGYGLVTLHRPSNVDNSGALKSLLETLGKVGNRLPLLFPVHPRTQQRVKDFGFNRLLSETGIHTLPPLSYHEMLGAMKDATLVLTDSGGIQEETTALGIPCITLRENTERPITLAEGTNTLVGTDAGKILKTVEDILETGGKSGRVPELWDGKSSERIADIVAAWLNGEAH